MLHVCTTRARKLSIEAMSTMVRNIAPRPPRQKILIVLRFCLATSQAPWLTNHKNVWFSILVNTALFEHLLQIPPIFLPGFDRGAQVETHLRAEALFAFFFCDGSPRVAKATIHGGPYRLPERLPPPLPPAPTPPHHVPPHHRPHRGQRCPTRAGVFRPPRGFHPVCACPWCLHWPGVLTNELVSVSLLLLPGRIISLSPDLQNPISLLCFKRCIK